MGARTFELDIAADEAVLLASGWLSLDSPDFPVAKRFSYASMRRPIIPPQLLKSTAYTLQATDNGALIIATGAMALTVPIASALGVGFRCTMYGDGAAMTVSRSGGGTITVASGELWALLTANNKILIYKSTTPTVL